MNDKILSTFTVPTILFQFTSCPPATTKNYSTEVQKADYGPDVRTFTVEGTIDPRLYAFVVTTYRRMKYDGGNKDAHVQAGIPRHIKGCLTGWL